MKIKQLIEELSKYPQDNEIYLSGDPEGNDIRTIDLVGQMPLNDVHDTVEDVVIFPTDDIVNL